MTWAALRVRRRRLRRITQVLTLFQLVLLGLAVFVHEAWLAAAVAAGYVTMVSVRRWSQGAAVVLWLRKFGATDSERSVFTTWLGVCCSGIAIPVTIQDSSLRYSYHEATARSFRSFPLLMLAFCAINLILIGMLFAIVEDPTDFRYTIPLVVCEMLVFVPLARWLWERGGAVALAEPPAVERFFMQIKSGRPATGGLAGIAVVKVEHSKWTEAIEVALRYTDIVVADVTRLSPYILWELSRATQRLVPRQFVFAYGVNPDDRESVPEELQNTLASVLGRDTVAECSWFIYTKRRARWQLLEMRENGARTLQLAAVIAFALCRADADLTFKDIQDELNSEVVSNQVLRFGSLGLSVLMVVWFLIKTADPYTLSALALASLVGLLSWASGAIFQRVRPRIG